MKSKFEKAPAASNGKRGFYVQAGGMDTCCLLGMHTVVEIT